MSVLTRNDTRRKNKDFQYYLLSFIVLAFFEWFFFRNVIGTDQLFGDSGDGRLTMLITEHWFHVFQGKATVTDLGMCWPAPNTLAYSDMLLGFGLIHSLLRLFGMDMFSAYKLTLILIHVFGTVSSFLLLRKVLKTGWLWALFGTAAFSFSSTYASMIGHPQLVAVSLIPLATILAIRFFQNFENRKRRNILAICFILLVVLVLYTAWYIAFFTALFTVTLLCVLLVQALRRKLDIRKRLAHFFRTLRYDLVLYVLIAAVTVIPFALLELSVMEMSGGRNFSEINIYMPEFIDLINVGTENWLLGGLIARMNLTSRSVAQGEVGEGFSVILLLLFVISIVHLARCRKMEGSNLLIPAGVGFTVILSLILIIKMSSNGIALWWFIYRFFPGASSLRAIGRYMLFLSFPMSMVTAFTMDRIARKGDGQPARDKWTVPVTVVLLVLLFVTNIKTDAVFAAWDKVSAENFIQSVQEPPEDCEVFFLNPEGTEPRLEPYVQLDAYQIADYFGIKTINGYSGVSPKGWDRVWYIYDPGYRDAVAGWAAEQGIEKLYEYNAGSNTWSLFDPLAAAGSGT